VLRMAAGERFPTVRDCLSGAAGGLVRHGNSQCAAVYDGPHLISIVQPSAIAIFQRLAGWSSAHHRGGPRSPG